MELFYLLLLSIPFFYLIGLISFLKWFFGGRKQDDDPPMRVESYVKTAIHEFEIELKEKPSLTVKELLAAYKRRLADTDNSNKSEVPTQTHEKVKASAKPVNAETFWANWYSNNSINLLLYIGAFLIVTSASIFVGFQWETISGVVKASLLTLCAVAFFISGLWFYSIPKIRSAGNTFIGIGALLIPILGSAWYTFVLQNVGIAAGVVWLTTSIIAGLLYITLSIRLHNRFYAYLSTFASLSFTLSVVQTMNLPDSFFILGAANASIVLLTVSILLKDKFKTHKHILQDPYEISSQIIMPISLVFGLLMQMSEVQLFTIQASAGLFISALFYGLTYFTKKDATICGVAVALFSLAIVFLLKSQGMPNPIVWYVIAAIGYGYFFISFLLRQQKRLAEADAFIVIGITQQLLMFLFSLFNYDSAIHIVILSAIVAISGIVISFLKNTNYAFLITTMFLGIGLFVFHTDVLTSDFSSTILFIEYVVLGIAWYGILMYFRKLEGLTVVNAVSSAVYLGAAIVLNLDNMAFVLVVCLIIALITFHAAAIFAKEDLQYIGLVFLVFSMIAYLAHTQKDFSDFPLYFEVLFVVFYGVSFLVPKNFTQSFSRAGLIGGLANTAFFGLAGSFDENTIIKRNSLISSYITTLLYASEASVRKSSNLAYIASAFGVVTYLWQIHLFGVTETLFYTTPLGLYFMVLAYVQRLQK
jgi:hypothetical protein